MDRRDFFEKGSLAKLYLTLKRVFQVDKADIIHSGLWKLSGYNVEVLIKRSIFDDLINHLPKREITLISGPRQAGKTTLMDLLREHVEAQGGRAVTFNLDIEEDRKFFDSQENMFSSTRFRERRTPVSS